MFGMATLLVAGDNQKALNIQKSDFNIEVFTFSSQGKNCKGKIYIPQSYESTISLPAVYLVDFTEQHFTLATDEFERVIEGVNQVYDFDALVVSLDGIPDIDAEPISFEEHYTIFKDLSKYVSSVYTDNPSRTLIGKGSESGIVLMALFLQNSEKPVFDNFVVTDPSPMYASAIIDLIHDDNFPKSKLNKKLHFSFSTSNDRAKCNAVIRIIRESNYPWLQFEAKEYTESNYENTYPLSYAEGLQFVYKDYKQMNNMKEIYESVEFESQRATLRGRLYLPQENVSYYPVIVMAHGFTTTINGMTADKYAEEFQRAGYAVLLYDHRNLGISEGKPRQEINFWIQSRGYIDAIDFLWSRSEIDTTRIAVWGASLSSREAFLVGTVDNRVKSVISMIPAFGEEIPSKDQNGDLYALAKKILSTDDISMLPQTKTERIPIVSSDQILAPSALSELTAYRWFIEYGGRFGTNWQNVVSFSRLDVPEDLNVGQFANQLKAPILMIVATNDEMNGANPKVTKYVFNNITQPKEWVNIDGGHFGLLYHPSDLFNQSSQAQIDFLKKYLK